MIRDNSGLPNIGLAILRSNLEKLTPPRVCLTHRGGQQLLVVETGDGIGDNRYESNSFTWGDDSAKSRALLQALEILGVTPPKELKAEEDYNL